jgi:endonuclease/exonuclease/phosphatase family metal-dependent hydrolase
MRLWNLAPLIPEAHRFTRVFNGRRELIDHILVSHRLVHASPQVDTGGAELPSIGSDPGARRDQPASDHAPLVAKFDLA